MCKISANKFAKCLSNTCVKIDNNAFGRCTKNKKKITLKLHGRAMQTIIFPSYIQYMQYCTLFSCVNLHLYFRNKIQTKTKLFFAGRNTIINLAKTYFYWDEWRKCIPILLFFLEIFGSMLTSSQCIRAKGYQFSERQMLLFIAFAKWRQQKAVKKIILFFSTFDSRLLIRRSVMRMVCVWLSYIISYIHGCTNT